MKHSYRPECACARCSREHARRSDQSLQDGNSRKDGRPMPRMRRVTQTALDRWAREYYETDSGCDRYDPSDR